MSELMPAIRKLPAAAGWQWWKSGTVAVLDHPKLFLFCVVVTGLSQLIESSWLSLLSFFSLTFFRAWVAAAFFAAEEGESQSLANFMRTATARWQSLLAIGGITLLLLIGVGIILGVAVAISGGLSSLMALKSFTAQPDAWSPEQIAALFQPLLVPLMIAMLLLALVLSAWCFAPFLAVWPGMGAAAAMKLSFRAMWSNWTAFLVSGLVAFAGLMAITLLCLVPMSVFPQWTNALLVLVSLLIWPFVYGNWFFSCRTIFALPDPCPDAEASFDLPQ
jgi:hypothetical protein